MSADDPSDMAGTWSHAGSRLDVRQIWLLRRWPYRKRREWTGLTSNLAGRLDAGVGAIPGIGKAFRFGAGSGRLARLQRIERTTAPAGIVDALNAKRVLADSLSKRRACHQPSQQDRAFQVQVSALHSGLIPQRDLVFAMMRIAPIRRQA